MRNQQPELDDKTVEEFQTQGATVLRGAFVDWVGKLSSGVADLMEYPGPFKRIYQGEEGTAPFFQDLCNWQRIDEFRDFVLNGPAGAIAAQLMGSRNARFFHDHVLVKEPGTSIETPWHQDMPYYCVGGRKTVSFWIPLDPVNETTTLRCVAGSHAWEQSHRPKRFDGSDLYDGDESEEIPDIDANPDRYEILAWPLEPGDAVAFDFRTVHGAAANTGSGTRRRVFSARWVGDDAVFVDREGKGSPPFPHLTLASGEPLTGPDFPVAWER